MLKNTFCHIPGISCLSEQRLWSVGIHDWDGLSRASQVKLPRKAKYCFAQCIEESLNHLEKNNPKYFAALLPTNQHWRLFSDFRDSVAYLDIETTGLWHGDSITTIAIYDGENIFHYVKNQNLDDFKRDLRRYNLIVTYNGKCFDVPFIERQFGISVNQAHIDLRYVLKSLGYSGGLKRCERQIGIERKDLADVDGYFAVLLWDDYIRNKNEKSLETLLAYNVHDVVSLEALLVVAYNLKLEETPFVKSHSLRLPAPPRVPFRADRQTIDNIKRQNPWAGAGFRRSRW